MVQWPLSANGRRLAALVALGALTACATPPAELSDETSGAGWRVVERVGQARYSPPDAATWLAAITGQPISDGSEVETGRGGRLILAMPGRHISVGPASHFVLPRSRGYDRLEQRAGWLSYRVVTAAAEPFRVRTPSLDLEFVTAMLDVRVEQDGVDVTVREGEVRLATPDGLRRTEIAAGQSARAIGPGGTQLAVRRTPDGAAEPVDPPVVPAIHPAPPPPVAPVTEPAPMAKEPPEPTALILPSVLDRSDQAAPLADHGREAIELAPRSAVPGTDEVARSADPRMGAAGAGPSMPATTDQGQPVDAARAVDGIHPSNGRTGQFERLTEGMIDGVRPLSPTSVEP
jgi:FecR protein